VIRSPHNSKVAAARELRARKERTAARAFLVEGPHATLEALRSDHVVRELFLTPDVADSDDALREAAGSRRVAVTLVDAAVAATLGETVHPQGAFAVVEMPSIDLTSVLQDHPRLLVLLAKVADPGNAGTVIRTADAAGADAVVVSRESVDPFGGKCVRSSAGSVLHVPIVTGVDAATAIDEIRHAGVQVLAAALDGDDLFGAQPALSRPTAWLFGSEAHGLGADLAARADQRLRIPTTDRVESLNLASAAAVCLFASARALGTNGV